MEKNLDIDIILPSKYQMAIKGKENDLKNFEEYIKNNHFESIEDISEAFKHFDIRLVEVKENKPFSEISKVTVTNVKN